MAKRLVKKSSKTPPKTPKIARGKSIFDHLKALTQENNDNYWNEISDADRRTFSPYMNNRLLSMNPDWIELVDDLQRYTIGLLKPREVFRMFADILPKGRFYFPYVKAIDTRPIPDEMATLIARDYECSMFTAKEYCRILLKSEEGKNELRELVQRYGLQLDAQKKLKKELGL